MFDHDLSDLDDDASRTSAAEAYDRLAHQPEHPYVTLSYGALKRVIIRQFDDLDAGGFCFQFDTIDPYGGDSSRMLADLDRGFIRVFADRSATLPADHPFKGEISERYGDLTWNDVFRAVHDVMGHGVAHSSFGPLGEYRAWLAHRATMPRIALNALWCETRGQNTWTNFYADHFARPQAERPYADQRAGLVSSIFW